MQRKGGRCCPGGWREGGRSTVELGHVFLLSGRTGPRAQQAACIGEKGRRPAGLRRARNCSWDFFHSGRKIEFFLTKREEAPSLSILVKSLFYLLQLSPKFGFPPTIIKPGISPPSTFQTVHFISFERFWRLFATVTVVLSFSFLKKFQLNLWKIIVNHKKIIK